MIELSLVESNARIEEMILRALVEDLNSTINRALKPITDKVRPIIEQAIKGTPEYSSLLGGTLQGELGVVNPQLKLENIIDVWVKSTTVKLDKVTKLGKKLKGGLTLTAIDDNFENVTSMRDAIQVTGKGQQLPWLEWLLLRGDEVIIKDYEINTGPRANRSRTGLATMVSVERGKWRVPPEFSGTEQSNFVTRAIDSIDDNIQDIIIKQIQDNIL